MSRPKPNILLEYVNKKTYRTEQVLQARAIWAVFYQNKPFNKKVKPTLKTELIKLNIDPISLAPEPPKEDPRLKELELRVLESQKRNQFEKSRGLPNLIGTKV